eukprot:3827335-Rhodomonas_salina.1
MRCASGMREVRCDMLCLLWPVVCSVWQLRRQLAAAQLCSRARALSLCMSVVCAECEIHVRMRRLGSSESASGALSFSLLPTPPRSFCQRL